MAERVTTELRLLILEDSLLDAELEVAQLEAAGYACRWQRVQDRAQFAHCLETDSWDLVILDYNLPDFDGLSALALVRDHNADIPVILVSGTIGEEVAVDTLKAGAADCVLKSNLARLAPVVQRALRAHEEHRARLQAEAAVRASEMHFRALIEHSAEAVALVAADGSLRYVSPVGLRIFGRSVSEDLGQSVFEFIHPDDMANVAGQFAQLLEQPGASITTEFRYQHPDGSWNWIEAAGTNWLGDPAVHAVVVNYRDITNRKQGEESLRASEAKFRQLSETLPQLIWTARADGSLDYLSPQWEAYTGISEREQVGRDWLAQIHQDDRDRTIAMWNAMVGSGMPIDLEVRIRRKDGVYRWFNARAVALRDHEGRVVKLLGASTDIDDHKQAEEKRGVLETQLRQAQKMEALGTLAGGIAHDFNNILGAIIGNTELARQDVGPGHPAIESLTEIRKASNRAKSLVDRILAVGRQQQQPQSVIALRPVVEEVVALLRATLPAGVELAAACDDDTPTVLADPTQVHQVLMNLCTNAWHAMDGHTGHIDIRIEGITLDAEAAAADVHLRPGRFARLCVTDNGSGMDAATLERIFEPFFTTKPVGQGTGLGLSVVHGIVKAHGGAITVTAQPGRGTTFHLYFPAAEAPQQGVAPRKAAIEPLTAAGGRHVLYLDDEESLVSLATRTFERLGYRVSGYTRAEEALAAVRADPGQFDVVITDLNMPGISGLEVAGELSRLRPDLPVVLTSGYIPDELRAKAAAAGVRELIYKPTTVEDLCGVVQRLAGAAKVREAF